MSMYIDENLNITLQEEKIKIDKIKRLAKEINSIELFIPNKKFDSLKKDLLETAENLKTIN